MSITYVFSSLADMAAHFDKLADNVRGMPKKLNPCGEKEAAVFTSVADTIRKSRVDDDVIKATFALLPRGNREDLHDAFDSLPATDDARSARLVANAVKALWELNQDNES